MVERIPAGSWWQYTGHTERYGWAASRTWPGEVVNDVACGVGYGSVYFGHARLYRGYDKEGVPARFPRAQFFETDIDDPAWSPAPADVTCCFETLEHVKDPARLARLLMASTRRAVFVSVPVIPTVHCNQWHRTDFTVDDVPRLFSGWVVERDWAQPEETSHVWMFTRG